MNNDMWNFCISELALQGNLDPTAEEINQFYENYLVGMTKSVITKKQGSCMRQPYAAVILILMVTYTTVQETVL